MHQSNDAVFSAMQKTGLLPVIANTDVSCWQNIIDLCHHSGIRAIEFRDAIAGRGVDLFRELVAYAIQYPDLHLGVSTIQKEIAEKYIQGGASFITSSFMKADMAELAFKNLVPWIPGCSSTVDLDMATRLGANTVSLLPGSFRPSELPMLRREYPHLRFIPSPGIMMKQTVVKEWTRAGVICVRMGSQLFSAQSISVKDWVKIEQNILSVISAIRTVRLAETKSAYSEH